MRQCIWTHCSQWLQRYHLWQRHLPPHSIISSLLGVSNDTLTGVQVIETLKKYIAIRQCTIRCGQALRNCEWWCARSLIRQSPEGSLQRHRGVEVVSRYVSIPFLTEIVPRTRGLQSISHVASRSKWPSMGKNDKGSCIIHWFDFKRNISGSPWPSGAWVLSTWLK